MAHWSRIVAGLSGCVRARGGPYALWWSVHPCPRSLTHRPLPQIPSDARRLAWGQWVHTCVGQGTLCGCAQPARPTLACSAHPSTGSCAEPWMMRLRASEAAGACWGPWQQALPAARGRACLLGPSCLLPGSPDAPLRSQHTARWPDGTLAQRLPRRSLSPTTPTLP